MDFTAYYRLRQVDLDGTATYSPVRTVQFNHSFTIAPIPARLVVAGLSAGTSVEVFDAPWPAPPPTPPVLPG